LIALLLVLFVPAQYFCTAWSQTKLRASHSTQFNLINVFESINQR